VAQGKNFRVFVPVAHGQQPEQRERVGHAEVGQSKQHGQASSPRHAAGLTRPRTVDASCVQEAQDGLEQGG
jgi:hypothetical protein